MRRLHNLKTRTQNLILTFTLILNISVVKAQSGDTFAASNKEGVTIYYTHYRIGYSKIEEYASVNSGKDGEYSYVGDIIIPSTVKYKNIEIPVKEISYSAFENCKHLTSVIVPNSVKEMGSFSNCKSLKSITLSNAITSIDSEQFYNCTSLKEIIIPEHVQSIAYRAFYKCFNLADIKLPAKLKEIDLTAFASCHKLKNIVIPNSLTTLGDEAFYDCVNLESIQLGNSLNYIGKNAFNSCSKLTSIIIPNSVTLINEGAFANCTNLEKVILSEQMTSIEPYTFKGCKLKSINITTSIEHISEYAFYNCNNLDSISVSSQNLHFYSTNGILYNKNKTVLIKCPPAKTGTLIIPNTTLSIKYNAFSNTSLDKIYAPEHLLDELTRKEIINRNGNEVMVYSSSKPITQVETQEDTLIYKIEEKMPEFPGGSNDM